MEGNAGIKTSVIIPVYNTSAYIRECIDSVFQQTQKEIEVIAVDDGSTDDSLSILLDLRKKYPSLIVIAQENQCQGYARNVGMKIASGKYIYFLDSDDYILENTLERCYEYAAKNGLDVVMFDALDVEDSDERTPIEPNYDDRHDIISEREEVFSGIDFLEKYYQKTYNPCTCLVYCSAEFLKKNDVWFLPKVYFEDNEFYCRIMTLAERVMYIPEMFYRCRCRKTSTTRAAFDLRKAQDHIKVVGALADLKTINGGKGWNIVRQISLDLLRYAANMCYSNSLYRLDGKISEAILCTWMKICGGSIDEIERLEDIEYMYRICGLFPDSDLIEARKHIYDKLQQLLIKTLRQMPLDQQGIQIAIYGCGKYTDRLLDFYEKNVGDIEADIIFLNSYTENANMKYRGYPVYHVGDIMEKKIDHILISSPNYEDEMHTVIRQLYGDKFRVFKLYGDLHINL